MNWYVDSFYENFKSKLRGQLILFIYCCIDNSSDKASTLTTMLTNYPQQSDEENEGLGLGFDIEPNHISSKFWFKFFFRA